jgi:hypothetical protein
VETQKRAANFRSRGLKNSLESAIFLDDSFLVPILGAKSGFGGDGSGRLELALY